VTSCALPCCEVADRLHEAAGEPLREPTAESLREPAAERLSDPTAKALREPTAEPLHEPTAERFVVTFANLLRGSGVDVPVGSVITFAQALGEVGLDDRDHVYWAGRATLVRRPEDRNIFDRVFAEFFEDRQGYAVSSAPAPRSVTIELDSAGDGSDPDGDPTEPSNEPTLTVRYSATELLRHLDFDSYDESDWAQARRLMSELRAHAETRRSRRLRPSSRRHGSLDLPATVRAALASDGEAIQRSWRRPAERPRRLVYIVDISGSMQPYARAFLRFAHATVSARATGETEIFVLGTRLTRITRALSWRDPDAALADAGRLVADWYGGTRLGAGLKYFNDRWGNRGMARGAVVVIMSDGWDRGDPAELAQEMARLRRVARRIVWVNPLRASPGYEPVARGMAAALPFVDDFVDGHSLAALEALVAVVAGDTDRRRPAARRQPDGGAPIESTAGPWSS
jgi:uncharacterized protein with von Willebrand factor type A (vWA) domain